MLRSPLAVIASALVALACACTSTTTTTTTAPQDITANPVVASGECVVKGYDCSAIGAACADKCYATDGRKDAYVALAVSGKALDSRTVPFDPVDPVNAGDRTLRYGCGLFTASDGTQGLELLYRKNETGAAFEDDTTLRIDGFGGPGGYQATVTVRYTPSDTAQTQGLIYAKKSGCSIDVHADGRGGVEGTVSCPTVPNAKDGTTVSISGDFACDGTALEPISVKLP